MREKFSELWPKIELLHVEAEAAEAAGDHAGVESKVAELRRMIAEWNAGRCSIHSWVRDVRGVRCSRCLAEREL